MGDRELPYYLAPIIEGGHWTLVVACPAKNTCYWLDSLGGKPNEDIKTMFADGLKTYRQLFGAKEQGGPKWYYPKGTPSADTTLSISCSPSFPPDVLYDFNIFLIVLLRSQVKKSIRFEML
ncbi:hypothetical protein K1719_038714 [Acacia pycnantha]|nr:hypothetical protein K1719_038714 [Acacia pycnantha]